MYHHVQHSEILRFAHRVICEFCIVLRTEMVKGLWKNKLFIGHRQETFRRWAQNVLTDFQVTKVLVDVATRTIS